MAKAEILHCFPTLEKTKDGWKKRGKVIGRYDERSLAVTEGSKVIQVVEGKQVKWVDPATGHELHRTKGGKGDGLWDEKDQVYYHPYLKEDF